MYEHTHECVPAYMYTYIDIPTNNEKYLGFRDGSMGKVLTV